MDKRIYKMHADMCKVFTSPVRIEILNLLGEGERTVSELVELTGLRQPNVSQHLNVMKEKGIVATNRVGNKVFYSLTNPKISEAFRIIKQILEDRLAESKGLYRSIKEV
jgi:ArsR family transcriptional regulator